MGVKLETKHHSKTEIVFFIDLAAVAICCPEIRFSFCPF